MTPDPGAGNNGREPAADASAAEFFRPRGRQASDGPACPAPGLLRAFHAGTLSPPMQERVGSHVAGCVMCQLLGEALTDSSTDILPEEDDRILARIRTELGASTAASRAHFMRPALAAAAAIAIVSASIALWQSRVDPVPADESSALRLEKPAVRLPNARTDLVWRGPANAAPVDELSAALEPYRADDFEEANRRLASLVSRYPGDGFAQFYLGVTQLLSGSRTPMVNAPTRYTQAVAALEAAERLTVDDRELAHEASWYLALAYERTGQRQRASDKLRLLCRDGGVHAEQACAGVGELAGASTLPPPTLPPAK
jgi:hypothetical protein